TRKIRGRQSDFENLLVLPVMPLLSQAANGARAGRHTKGQPAPPGRQEILEPACPDSYGTLRAAHPNAIPLRSIQVGKYWRSSPLVFSLEPRCQGQPARQK